MSQRIKICHLTSAHKSDDVRIFFKECSSLAKNDLYEVHFICVGAKDETINKVRIHNVSNPPANTRVSRMYTGVNEVYKKAIEVNAQVYHLHDPELLRIALKLNTFAKVVYDVHEDLPRQIMGKYWIPKVFRKTLSRLIESYENYISQRIDAVVTATPFIRKRFELINKKCIDVNNYPILNEGTSIPIEGVGQPDYVCYAGGITSNRGVAPIVDALNFLPNMRLKLAGRYSPASFRDELVIKDSWSKVEELGYISRDEVKSLISGSIAGLVTLFPLPNYLDSLPIKMFEYMREGVPVIASNFPYWTKIIESNECGLLVDPNNPKEISDAILYLKENPLKAKKMGTNGKKAVKLRFNWQIESEKLLKLYVDLTHEKSIKRD